jgi:hypothetical protein
MQMAKSKQDDKILIVYPKLVSAINNFFETFNALIAETQLETSDSEAEMPKKVEPTVEEKHQPTLEEVRAVLADLSRKGYTTNVRMMLVGCGVSKLSEVAPKDYAGLLAKAQELSDAIKD